MSRDLRCLNQGSVRANATELDIAELFIHHRIIPVNEIQLFRKEEAEELEYLRQAIEVMIFRTLAALTIEPVWIEKNLHLREHPVDIGEELHEGRKESRGMSIGSFFAVAVNPYVHPCIAVRENALEKNRFDTGVIFFGAEDEGYSAKIPRNRYFRFALDESVPYDPVPVLDSSVIEDTDMVIIVNFDISIGNDMVDVNARWLFRMAVEILRVAEALNNIGAGVHAVGAKKSLLFRFEPKCQIAQL